MIKYDYDEEEMEWMRSKLLKLGFLSNMLKSEPNSCCDVGEEPMQRHGVQVSTS